MIKISKSGNAILVEGLDNVFYPNNGKITYPSNSIILTLDKSDMATFRSAANNDVLFSGLIEDITIAGSAVTKDNIVTSFGAIAYVASGGGGGTGAVSSVNGQTGDVVITAASIDAAPNSELTAVKNRVGVNEKNIANNSGSISTLQTNMLGKQDTLVSGTNIKTVGGESILGSGNIIEKEPAFDKWKTGGNISVGESSTASGTSVSIGKNATSSLNSVSIGAYSNSTDALDGSAIGAYSEVTNSHEIALGTYNKSVNAGTDADKTQFTVAAADATQSDKKNCLEIRRDNSIYIWKDGAQVKLQDELGGGSGSVSWNDITGKPTVPTAQKGINGTNTEYIWASNSAPAYHVTSDVFLKQVDSKLLLQTTRWNDPKTLIVDDVPLATTSADGIMSKEDKAILEGLPSVLNKKQATLTAGDNITLSEPDPTTGSVTISATGGGSGGGVTSVNGQTGVVTLDIPTVQTTADGNENNYIYSSNTDILKRVLIPSYFNTNADSVSLMGTVWGGTNPGSHELSNLYGATKTKAGVMSAADKTKLDTIPTMSVLTQAEYDAITTKDANTLYFIKEG